MEVTKKDMNFINVAFELATKSDMLMKHGCVIVRNNKIIGKGYNSLRTQFNDNFIGESCSCHAEMHALREAVKTKYNNKCCIHNRKRAPNIKVAKVA